MDLLLENGEQHAGIGFGGGRAVAGEVVFNTGMSGYVETLTDPSYRGQILVLTYPLVGNYGVPPKREASSLGKPFESGAIQVQGLIVQHFSRPFSHHRASRSLGSWLESEDIPAVHGIDTRRLTKTLRASGTMRGWLLPAGKAVEDASEVDMLSDVFHLVSPPESIEYPGDEALKVMLVDVGAKDNIVRSLLARGIGVKRVPWHADLKAQAVDVDGIVIGNGPGDPKNLGRLIEQIRELMTSRRRAMFGICLGHQILSLAAGGDTYKLPFGHRGVNQPVQDLFSRRCFITSQNHGYAVDADSLPKDWEPWFVNINDGTNEGIRSRSEPFLSVQFHPEACPGPEDTAFLFDEFIGLVRATRRN